MKTAAINTHSAPETLAEEVMSQIRNGTLKPGGSLPSQRELASRCGVGLGTVREAFKILNAMGFVRVYPGKGMFVADDALQLQTRPSSIEEALEAVSLAELMKAREVVESSAAGLAAEKADADSIQQLRKISDRMRAGMPVSERLYENDFEFHLAVAEASQNKAIFEIVKLLVDKAHYHITFMNTILGISLPSVAGRCVGSALRIIGHIEQKDAVRAETAMREHLATVSERLTGLFPSKPVERNFRTPNRNLRS